MGKWKPRGKGTTAPKRPTWDVVVAERPGATRSFELEAVDETETFVLQVSGPSLTAVLRQLAEHVAAQRPAPGAVYLVDPATANLARRYLPQGTRVEVADELPFYEAARFSRDMDFGSDDDNAFLDLPDPPGFPDDEAPTWLAAISRLLAANPSERGVFGTALVFDDAGLPGCVLRVAGEDGHLRLELFSSEADYQWLPGHDEERDEEEDDDGDWLALYDKAPRHVVCALRPRAALTPEERQHFHALGLEFPGDTFPMVYVSEKADVQLASAADRDALLAALDLLSSLLEQVPEPIGPGGASFGVVTQRGRSTVRVLDIVTGVLELWELDASATVLQVPGGWCEGEGEGTPALVVTAEGDPGELVEYIEAMEAVRHGRCASCGEVELLGLEGNDATVSFLEHGEQVPAELLAGDSLLVLVVDPDADPLVPDPSALRFSRRVALVAATQPSPE